MPEICFITTCKGRLEHLKQTLPTWVDQPNTCCIVVDYSCPNRCGDWVEQNHSRVQVVRVPDKSRFHLTHARNVGASMAHAPWLMFIDADVAVAPTFSETMLSLPRDQRFFKSDISDKELAGTVLCPRSDFLRVGSYDDVMQGYGFEDTDLYARLRWVGLQEARFPPNLLRGLSHDDELRVKFYDTKAKVLSDRLNRYYARSKYDLMKLVGKIPSQETCRKLYRLLTRWVELNSEPGGCDLRMGMLQRTTPAGTMENYLTCTLIFGESKQNQETAEVVVQ